MRPGIVEKKKTVPKTQAVTKGDVDKILGILRLARRGEASLSQLAEIYLLADSKNLNAQSSEIRMHIHKMTFHPNIPSVGRDVVIGMFTGIVTHFILKHLSRR